MKPHMHQWGRHLASLRIFNVVLPILMGYLVAGTVAQKYMGLYEATQNFFLSPICFIGGVPLPGLPVFLAVLALNLLAHVLFKSPWRPEKTGILVTHIGVLTFLFGALFGQAFTQEGYIDVGERETAAIISDYHKRDFVIRNQASGRRYVLDFKDVLRGELSGEMPFKIEILESCRNCAIEERGAAGEDYHGMAQHMKLTPKTLELQNEENLAGATLRITGTQDDGVYTVLENIPVLPQVRVGDDAYDILIEKQKRALPFTLELTDVTAENYPGTQIAKAYTSRVKIEEGAAAWEAKIAMNEPLRYKGYALFQASFISISGSERSVLAVVYNPIRSLPYIAGFVICFGLLLHLIVRQKNLQKNLPKSAAAVVLGLMLLSTPAKAQAEEFLNQLDVAAFAGIPILHDGRVKPLDSFARVQLKHLAGREAHATRHLFLIFFEPQAAVELPLFKVPNREARAFLNLPKAKSNLYTYIQIQKALLDRRDAVPDLLKAPYDSLTIAQKEVLAAHTKTILFQGLLARPQQDLQWAELVEAYQARDAAAWNAAAQTMAAKAPRPEMFALERAYNTLKPFTISAALYGAALALLLLGFLAGRTVSLAAFAALGLGACAHIIGIMARVFILERPPVGTLYESILFAGVIVALFAFMMFLREGRCAWLWLGACGGLLLHLLGFANDAAPNNMVVMQAVLNTNFWLTIHVLTITAGYAFCICASLLAHMALAQNAMQGALYDSLKRTALLALLFTTAGTLLGGVWADQSWGRFWGWDPKENGALLIILWLVWVLHGEISQSFSRPLVVAGLAFTSAIVALSWFGVNLLGVGLHSYGFTDFMIWALAGFIALEAAIIAALLYRRARA